MALRLKWVNRDTKREVEFTPDLVVGGIDFGFGNPFALEVGAKVGNVWLNVFEHYASHMDTMEMVHLCRKAREQFGITRFWCDTEDPQGITDLQKWGLPAMGNLVNGPGSLNYGLRTVYGLLKTKVHNALLGYGPRFRVVRPRPDGQSGCPNLIREFGRYAWPQSKGEILTAKPIDRDNHAIGAVRYYTVGEGEIPPEDTRVPLEEQPRMFLNEQGQWVDNPRAAMAQAHMAQHRSTAWWDEQDVPLLGSRYIPDEN